MAHSQGNFDDVPESSFEALRLMREYYANGTLLRESSLLGNEITFQGLKKKFVANHKSHLRSFATGENFLLQDIYILCKQKISNSDIKEFSDFVIQATLTGDNDLCSIEDPNDFTKLLLFLSKSTDIFNGFDIIQYEKNKQQNKQQQRNENKLDINNNKSDSKNNDIELRSSSKDRKNNLNNKMNMDDDIIDLNDEPPHKRRKLVNGRSIGSHHHNNNDINNNNNNRIDLSDNINNSIDLTNINNNNNNSMFNTESDIISSYNKNDKPFWETLPMPVITKSSDIFSSKFIKYDNNSIKFRECIREDGTRNSILNSTNNRKSLVFISNKQTKARLTKLIHTASKNPEKIILQNQQIRMSKEEKALRERKLNPIIIVPSSMNTLISMTNAKQFLQNQKYIKNTGIITDANQKIFFIKRPSKLLKDEIATFEVRDSPGDGGWSRVAAVFAVGKKWQFRGWPPGWQTPEQIFSKVAGFYVHWADAHPEGEVARWRLNFLALNRVNAHDHARVANAFWTQLYAALARHRNNKLFY